MDHKKTFKLIIVFLVIMLSILPFVTTFNSFLTTIVNNFKLYRILQDFVVPIESRLVVAIVRWFDVPAYLAQYNDPASFYILKGNEYMSILIEWNCLGWQSILLLGISFVFGLDGNFTNLSKMECIVIGILGTFLINLLRMVFIVAGVYFVNDLFALLIHDYFAALTTIIWLFFFWWFSYTYVLNEYGEYTQGN